MALPARIALALDLNTDPFVTGTADEHASCRVLALPSVAVLVRAALRMTVGAAVFNPHYPNHRSRMIVNTGLQKLCDFLRTALGGYEWWLFANDATIIRGTVLADLTEASFTGYARVPGTAWAAAVIIDPRAQTVESAMPTFNNTGVTDTTIYGWALVTGGHDVLIAAQNIGATVIPAGLSLALSPAFTDKQE